MSKAQEIRQALVGACRRMGLPAPESCDGDVDHLRRALVAVRALAGFALGCAAHHVWAAACCIAPAKGA